MRFISRIFFYVLVAFSVSALSVRAFAQVSEQQAPAKSAKLAKTTKPAKAKMDAGIKKYGNVTFADPANHKYPIDNASHTRAAWKSIHVKSHAAKYKPEELARMKQRIHDAGVAQGIKFKEDRPKIAKKKAVNPSAK